jgi:hypothetical protein
MPKGAPGSLSIWYGPADDPIFRSVLDTRIFSKKEKLTIAAWVRE